MIIVKLTGGLGNQMFQYAAARRLAHANRAELKLDTGWFGRETSGDTPRRYELGVFPLSADTATPGESQRLRGTDTRRWPRVVKRLITAVGYAAPKSYVAEKHFHFDPDILRLKSDVYLDGYWQSEKYFLDTAEIIRKDFTLKAAPQGSSAALLCEIAECESVSLHFRRGDYITNSSAAAYHGIASLDYYARAIENVRIRIASLRLFVFSDDMEWVKGNLHTDIPVTYVEGNGPDNAAEDLLLMSACRHHIIANSSFSWWGAWLGSNPDKVVVAPSAWFSAEGADTSDLIPERWLRI
jgi:hypothetical protein